MKIRDDDDHALRKAARGVFLAEERRIESVCQRASLSSTLWRSLIIGARLKPKQDAVIPPFLSFENRVLQQEEVPPDAARLNMDRSIPREIPYLLGGSA